MERSLTVNKIGGANMNRMDQVLSLVRVLREKGENPILVVSAFKGVTDHLIQALDQLNGKNYDEAVIREAFRKAFDIVTGKIDEFIKTENCKSQAREHVQKEMDICIQTLLTHKQVTTTLAPDQKTYKIRDKIIAFGERSVVGVLEAYLQENNISAKAINDVAYKGNGEAAGTKVSKRELHRGIQRGIAEALNPEIENVDRQVLIIGGHVKDVLRGMISEIGRSYTDTTAVDTTLAIERILRKPVDATIAWKRIGGILSADPKQLDEAVNTPKIHHDVSLREAIEFAGAGSEVMQIDALSLALVEEVPLVLKDIENPEAEGTTFSIGESRSEFPFKVVRFNKNVDIVSFTMPEMAMMPGFVAELTQPFKEQDISINDILTAGTSISLTINLPEDEAEKTELRKRIRKTIARLRSIKLGEEVYECNPQWDKSKANVVIIGDELKGASGVLSIISGVLAAHRISIEGITHDSEQRKISLYVDKKNAAKAVQALHRVFIDKDEDYAKEIAGKIQEVMNSFLQPN